MSQVNNKEQRMLEEKISTLIPKMALPTIVASLITMVYNLVDAYFVSKLGTSASAAVGVNSSLEMLIMLAGNLVAVGTGSYISRLIGAKEKEHAQSLLSTMLFVSLIISLLLSVVGLTNVESMVDLLGANADCRQYSIDYANYVLLAAPAMVLSFGMNQTLRSEGSAVLAMVGMGFGGILNCFLDPVFIFTLDLGVAGASMATAISKTISFLILAYPYVTRKSLVRVSVRKIKFRWEDCAQVVSISSASFFRTILQIVSTTLINRVASAYSTSILAGISIGTRVMKVPFSVILGYAQGYQPVVGINWGAKRYDRVYESLRFSTVFGTFGSLAMGAVLFVFAEPIMRAFSDADGELIRFGITLIRLESVVMASHCMGAVINMFYSGIGHPMESLCLSTSRQGFCLIPMIYLLPALFGPESLVGCQAAADVLALMLVVPMIMRGFRIIRRAQETDC